MKIIVDYDMCEANAVCVKIAPEMFVVDDQEQLQLKLESPGPELQAKLEKAVSRCPRQALSIE